MSDKTATAKDRQQAHLWRVETGLQKREPPISRLTKRCESCGQDRMITEFQVHYKSKKPIKVCKSCQSARGKARFENKPEPVQSEPKEATKFCVKCRETKPVSSFHKNKSMADGLQMWCASCKTIQDRERRATKRQNSKACYRCKKVKPFEEFSKNGNSLHSWCKACKNEASRLRKQEKKLAETFIAPLPLQPKRPYAKPAMTSVPSGVIRAELNTPKPTLRTRLRFLFTGRLQ